MIFRFDEFELDTQRYELRRGAATIPLERQVFDVLAYLVENHERLVTKEELLDKVWGDRFVSDAALNSRVMAARKAIGDNGKEQRLIKTVHGRGYRFVGRLKTEEPSQPTERRAAPPFAQPAGRPTEQDIRFCTAPDGVRLAYAVVGEGAPLVKAPNWLSHLEFEWRSPVWRHWLEELSNGQMLVRYDQRGSGLSDWEAEDLTWEAWVHDLETVVDSLGLERFALLGVSQGGSVAIAYAVKHPERVSHLVLYGAYAQGWARRLKDQAALEEEEAVLTLMRTGWGRDNPAYRQIFASSFIPGASWEQMRWFNDLCRISASPENAVTFRREAGEVDVTELLPLVRTPTLVLHARGDMRVPFEQGRKLAAGIPGARFVPLDSQNHILLEDEPAWAKFLTEVRAFLGIRAPDGVTAGGDIHTILFTDLVGSTELTHRLGDSAARDLLREHEALVREALKVHGGSEVKTMGDGFMAVFHSTTRALECAVAIQRSVSQVASEGDGLRVRIGVNTGEPIVEEDDFFGSSVILAARLAAKAAGGEILVSDVVRQLAAGKGFAFADRGAAIFKGYEEPVRVFELRWGD